MKRPKIGENVKNEIKQMYESGISATLIASTIKKRHGIDIATNTIRQWASNNKWKKGTGVELKETINTLPIAISNELDKIDNMLQEKDYDSTEILKKLSDLFDKSYKELDFRLTDKAVVQTLEIDDLIKIIKTASEALIELKKINKKTGDVYIQFNFDIDYEKAAEENKKIEKIIEIKKEEEKTEDPIKKIEYDDVFDKLIKTSYSVNIGAKDNER